MSKIKVELGEFPYPLIEGPEESRYLTWVRNHSNYMAERGFLDYMRIVAILVRGILVNFLTILPYLMAAALVIGVLYNPMLDNWQQQLDAQRVAETANPPTDDVVEAASGYPAKDAVRTDWRFIARRVTPRPEAERSIWDWLGRWVWPVQDLPLNRPPFLFTPWLAILALLYYTFLFPVVIRLFKVATHKKSLATGSESSVKKRDWFERTFGGFLVAVLGVFLIELLPLLVHYFHQLREVPLRGLFATAAGGSSVLALSSAGKLLKVLGKGKQKVAMVLVGLLGLLLPLLVVLYVTEFLVYAEGDFQFTLGVLIALAVIPVYLGIAILIAYGLARKTGTAKDRRFVLRQLGLVVLAVAAIVGGALLIEGRWFFVFALAIEIWAFCWLSVDVNLTAVLGLYRDRLASAYLVGQDKAGDVDIEEDIDLQDICCYEAFSTAPYHLVNVAHNLQSSKDIGIRERNSDFFIFSKCFVGGHRTGYCRSESIERVYPQMDLATAMAISAAAAAPNMGRNTSGAMVALLTLLNVRLGYWVPNPGLLEADLAEAALEAKDGKALEAWAKRCGLGEPPAAAVVEERLRKMVEAARQPPEVRVLEKDLGFRFDEVFKQELDQLRARWKNVYGASVEAARGPVADGPPSPSHGLIGIGFSGGGIRSATINMGISQALHSRGVFQHIDYMSTVSGGGYLGSSISTLMRSKTEMFSKTSGQASVKPTTDPDVIEVVVEGSGSQESYRFRSGAHLTDNVNKGRVEEGEPLISHYVKRADLEDRYGWRVRPTAFLREMLSRLDETHRWVNLSDGGHLENLATIELLRRRCRFIITGDGEADPNLHFGSLAALVRYARIDLGIRIEIDPDQIRLRDPEKDRRSRKHFTVGRILYPKLDSKGYEPTSGYLLYLKSSFTGDEEEVIQEYRNKHNAFPHESTADQFFDEGQFEAYRALGQHIGERVLRHAPKQGVTDSVAAFFETWFLKLAEKGPRPWVDAEPEEDRQAPSAGSGAVA